MTKSYTRGHCIGPFLRQVASLLNISAAEIARKMSVSEGTVRQWLTGRRSLTTENAMAIILILGVDSSTIFHAYTKGYSNLSQDFLSSAFLREWINSAFIIHQELGSDITELRAVHAEAARVKFLSASRAMLDRKSAADIEM